MKAENIISEMEAHFRATNQAEALAVLLKMKDLPDPEYVYKYTYVDAHGNPYSYSRPLFGSKHRMRCLVNARGGYGGSNRIRIHRHPVDGWTDVTSEFVK